MCRDSRLVSAEYKSKLVTSKLNSMGRPYVRSVFSCGAIDIADSIKEHSFKLCIRHIMSLCSTLNSSVLDCRLNSFFFLSVRWGKSSISTLKLSLCRQTKLLFGNSLEERRRDLQSLFLVSFLSLLLFVPTSLSIP